MSVSAFAGKGDGDQACGGSGGGHGSTGTTGGTSGVGKDVAPGVKEALPKDAAKILEQRMREKLRGKALGHGASG